MNPDKRRSAVSLASIFGWVLLSTLPCSAQELNWAEKMFKDRSHDFGVVARGAEVSYRFELTNIYKEDVYITNVRTTCGCTAAQPNKDVLKSRETAYVEATMDTRRFTRRKDSNVIITVQAAGQVETVHIPITAYIRTDVVLEPGSASFGTIDQGTSAEKKLSVAYAGRNDWTIREVLSTDDGIQARVVETSRAGGRVDYDLFVTLDSSHPCGELRTQLMLVTDDENNPKVPVLVEGTIEADVTVTPSVISLGLLKPGESKTVNVVVKGKKPFQIEKIECDTDEPLFKVRLPKTSQAVHLFPLTVTPPEKSGTFTETFTLTILGRPEPVTFKAYGKVVGSESDTAPDHQTATETSLRQSSH